MSYRNYGRVREQTAVWLTGSPSTFGRAVASVLVVGELRRRAELIARRDRFAAEAIGLWLDSVVVDYADRILPITTRIAQRWAVITVPDPIPVVDGLLGATALEHDLILVTRSLEDVGGTGVRCANPFSGS